MNQDKPVLNRYTFKFLNYKAINDAKTKKVQKTSKKIEVTEVDTKEITIYSSVGEADRALSYPQPSISIYLEKKYN